MGIYSSDDLTFASSIAYYSLLSLFPFFLLAFSILGNVTAGRGRAGGHPGLRAAVLPPAVQRSSPTSSMRCSRPTSSWGIAGSLIMVWAAMGVFGAVTSAINHAWGVEKQPSYFKHKMISFVMLVAAGLLLMVGLLLVSAINIASTHWFAGVIANAPGASRAAGVRPPVSEHDSLHPHRRADLLLRPERLGAVPRCLGGGRGHGLLWHLAFAGFSWYVRDLSRLNMVHGSSPPSSSSSSGSTSRPCPAVRRRSDGRLRAPASSPAGGDPGGAVAACLKLQSSRTRWRRGR
jgi:hypothetical protein